MRSRSPCSAICRLAAGVLLAALGPVTTVTADTGADFPPGSVTFVESVPVEADLDLPELPDTAAIWLDLVEGAERTLDIFAFYLSPNPAGVCRLQPVLAAIEARARAGVRVRVLSDRRFHENYPETHERFDRHPDIAARLIDGRALWGGVMHSKGMVIDGERFFLGSQNWDWRALEHIHELGAVVVHAALASDLQRLFDLDWALAGGELTPPLRSAVPDEPEWRPVRRLTLPDGRTCEAVLAASPPQFLPEGIPWDLPLLLAQIDRAESHVRLVMLSYNPVGRDGAWWGGLDNALRRAAGRGCQVQILLSDWAKRPHMLPHIQSLAVLPGIEVRFVSIPTWSGGFIPFARTEHAKFVTCDGRALWLGTSNGSRDYFHQSRNHSLLLRGEGCTDQADAYFLRAWQSPYAATVDPCGKYTPPRRE